LPDQREFHSLTQSHRDSKREGTLAADGVIAMVTIDPATRKSRPLPDELAAAGRP
jgi:acyl-CoA thioesterase FadM